jgi:hypothetical protein
MTEELTDRFLKLFRGRGDCHGSWSGGCVREQLTRRHYHQHLTSGPHIGVYPMIKDKASWGCIDIDGKQHAIDTVNRVWDWEQMRIIAENLKTVLAVKNVIAHTERTANGIHVWVFPEEPLVAAATMRRALMAACKAVNYDPKEVNPKQEVLSSTQIGNYVRLPYPGALNNDPDARVVYLSTLNNTVHLADFVEHAETNRTSTAALAAVAELWKPPAKCHTSVNVEAGLDVSNLLPMISGLSYTVWRDGPLEGQDRSSALTRLAHLLAADTITPTAAYAILKSADERWGKYYSRADCSQQLQALIDRAYP